LKQGVGIGIQTELRFFPILKAFSRVWWYYTIKDM